MIIICKTALLYILCQSPIVEKCVLRDDYTIATLRKGFRIVKPKYESTVYHIDGGTFSKVLFNLPVNNCSVSYKR